MRERLKDIKAKIDAMRSLIWVVVGCQWGDEGKGAEVDRLSTLADLIVRFGGGGNAGHTIIWKGVAIALHLLPSAIVRGKYVAMAAGVSIDPLGLLNELLYVRLYVETDKKRITVDKRAIFSTIAHRVMDMASEIVRSREGNKIGTTAKGIGPSFADQASRNGLRMGDLLRPDFPTLLKSHLDKKAAILQSMGLTQKEWRTIFEELTNKEIVANEALLKANILTKDDLDYTRFMTSDGSVNFNYEAILNQYGAVRGELKNLVTFEDVTDLIHRHLRAGMRVLFEGAQAWGLDNVFGDFPFATATTTLSGGVSTGAGIPGVLVENVRGVAKAYATRVGAGRFLTKMDDSTANLIRGDGSAADDEYGATTKRARDCGWFCAVSVRTACRLNGVTHMTITKLDKLSGLEAVKICVNWTDNQGIRHSFIPAQSRTPKESDAKPTYITMPGWQQDISKARTWGDLPEEARNYIEKLEELLNHEATIPVIIDRIGVGPADDQIIVREDR